MGILHLFKKKPDMAKDPVCHMTVEVARARATSVYQGVTYYFCAPGCKHTFDQDPPKYLGSDKPAMKM